MGAFVAAVTGVGRGELEPSDYAAENERSRVPILELLHADLSNSGLKLIAPVRVRSPRLVMPHVSTSAYVIMSLSHTKTEYGV
jgi:hypothetical protein